MELFNPAANATFPAQSVAYTGTAGSTSGWSAGPEGVLIWSTTSCYVEIGEDAVATSASTPIPPFTPIPFKVPADVSGKWRVSALQLTEGGTVYAKPTNIR